MAAKIKKGDRIIVITGKDKGKKGDVVAVFPKENKVLISGINIFKHHQSTTSRQAGGIVQKEAKIAISNVSFIDPIHNKPTRIGFKIHNNNRKEKVRISKMSGEIINSARHDK